MTDSLSVEPVAKFVDGALSRTQHAADAANSLLQSGVDSVLHTSHQLRESAQHVSTKTIHFIQEEPIKSVLIAAATGAVLMALISMVKRPTVRA